MKPFRVTAMGGLARPRAKKLYGWTVKSRRPATFIPLLPYIQVKNRCLDIDRVGLVRVGALRRR
jgi:hypothetical protein